MGRRVLVVDDEPAVGESLIGLLTSVGYEARWVATAAAARAVVASEPTDLALVDLRLKGESGLDLIESLRELRPELSVIVVTALATIETAVEAMSRGADNFITKPVDAARLLAIVTKGLEAERLRRRSAQLDRLGAGRRAPLVAGSAPMREAVKLAEAVAARATTVLLLGETGTGKGFLAKHIHDISPRADRPFVELNCAGLSRELTESELFGHEKGAFTGATARKIGLFEAADGGTLFLDEIGEMDVTVQAKLLKVLEQQRFRRVGGVTEIAVDVRLVTATHRDLTKEVAEGRLRSDLYYRLNVFAIRLPPLRERKSEIASLARSFLRGPISDEAVELLEGYGWPGNVRELSNLMERAAILCEPGQPVGAEHLPPLEPAPVEPSDEEEPETLRDAERKFIESALRVHGGNILRAAQALGVSRGLLYRKMQKYKIEI